MVIQKLKLHEWFLTYQLDHIKKNNNHIPIAVQVDITKYANFFADISQKLPINALMMKLIGEWAELYPNGHKMLFRSWLGLKFLFGDEVRINLPIEIKVQGQSVITAIVVRNPGKKSLVEIASEIKLAKLKSIDQYPITRFAYFRKNNFFNRFFLKLLHWTVNSFPGLYWKKGGGCISVSSLTQLAVLGNTFSTCSYGPTGFTFFYKDILKQGNKTYLNLRIGIDHSCYSGIEAVDLVNKLVTHIQIEDQKIFKQITRDV